MTTNDALFHWPVGTDSERAKFDTLPGAWIAATFFAQRYNATGKWWVHTGLDLNLNWPTFDADAHAPVYAAAGGIVVFADRLPVWGMVITIAHERPDQFPPSPLWTRYAHVENVVVERGVSVQRGQLLARVGNADGRYPYHLHYDLARVDLGVKPGDWPGDNLPRVQHGYIDPIAFMRDQATAQLRRLYRVTARPTLRIRTQPRLTANIVGYLPYGTLIEAVESDGSWVRIQAPFTGWASLRWLEQVRA